MALLKHSVNPPASNALAVDPTLEKDFFIWSFILFMLEPLILYGRTLVTPFAALLSRLKRMARAADILLIPPTSTLINFIPAGILYVCSVSFPSLPASIGLRVLVFVAVFKSKYHQS